MTVLAARRRVRRVVVTGGSGLVGRHVIRELAAEFEVVNADLVPLSGVASVEVDVMCPDQVRAVLKGSDAVIHLAALDLAVRAAPEEFMRVNTIGTWHVLQAAAELNLVKVIVCSSVSATGLCEMRPDWVPLYLPIDESHDCRPSHAYGLSKLSIEAMSLGWARAGPMDILCMRLVPVLSTDADPSRLTGESGRPWLFSYVSADDVARGFRLALEASGPHYGVFFLTAADSTLDEPTLEWYEQRLGGLPQVANPRKYELNDRASIFSCSRAHDVLGWEPTSDFRLIRQAWSGRPPGDLSPHSGGGTAVRR